MNIVAHGKSSISCFMRMKKQRRLEIFDCVHGMTIKIFVAAGIEYSGRNEMFDLLLTISAVIELMDQN